MTGCETVGCERTHHPSRKCGIASQLWTAKEQTPLPGQSRSTQNSACSTTLHSGWRTLHYGYRAGHERQHYRVITSLPFTLGNDWKETTRFLERIQKLRHRADYETVGLATRTQVDELGKVVEKLQTAVRNLVR